MSARLLIADNSLHPCLFRPASLWRAHLNGVETETVNIPSGANIPPLSGVTHLILTGSEASILRPEPWFEVEAELIRNAVGLGLSVIGSCFGHQMLVYALSGPEYLRRADPPEVGFAKVEMIGSDPLFDGLPNPWTTFVYHFDTVIDPPAPWRKLGRTSSCDTHVLRYGDLPVWGIQAHPEISARQAKRFLWLTLLFGRKPLRYVLPGLCSAPPLSGIIDGLVRRFLEIGRPRDLRQTFPSEGT